MECVRKVSNLREIFVYRTAKFKFILIWIFAHGIFVLSQYRSSLFFFVTHVLFCHRTKLSYHCDLSHHIIVGCFDLHSSDNKGIYPNEFIINSPWFRVILKIILKLQRGKFLLDDDICWLTKKIWQVFECAKKKMLQTFLNSKSWYCGYFKSHPLYLFFRFHFIGEMLWNLKD